MRGIIIDGVATAGKTTILTHLQRKIIDEKNASTKLFISEHYTQRALEHLTEKGTLTAPIMEKHIDTLIHTLMTFQQMLDMSKFATNPRGAQIYVTLERGILTHFATDQRLQYSQVKKQLQQLQQLQMTQYIVTLSDDQIEKNLRASLQYRNDGWRTYIQEKGGIPTLVYEYIQWQNRLIELANHYTDLIPTIVIQADKGAYETYAEMIYQTCFRF